LPHAGFFHGEIREIHERETDFDCGRPLRSGAFPISALQDAVAFIASRRNSARFWSAARLSRVAPAKRGQRRFGGGHPHHQCLTSFRSHGALTTLYSFTGGRDGASPEASLILGTDGNLYGTTFDGGTNRFGTVFQITTNGVLTSLYLFTDGFDGARPLAGLVQGSDGSFYGTTSYGATTDAGNNPSRAAALAPA
jgi:uncharacterized repeat protein (TIGR03803 family)